MYCVMRASVPSLYNVYRRYDIHNSYSCLHKNVISVTSYILPLNIAVQSIVECSVDIIREFNEAHVL